MSLFLESKHSFQLRGKRQYLALQHFHFTKVHPKALGKCWCMLKKRTHWRQQVAPSKTCLPCVCEEGTQVSVCRVKTDVSASAGIMQEEVCLPLQTHTHAYVAYSWFMLVHLVSAHLQLDFYNHLIERDIYFPQRAVGVGRPEALTSLLSAHGGDERGRWRVFKSRIWYVLVFPPAEAKKKKKKKWQKFRPNNVGTSLKK